MTCGRSWRAFGIAARVNRSVKALSTRDLNSVDTMSLLRYRLFNLYRLAGPGSVLRPCEMSSAKIIEFVLGFEPGI